MRRDASSEYYKWIVIETERLSVPWMVPIPSIFILYCVLSSKHKLRYFNETWDISVPPLNICSTKIMKNVIKNIKSTSYKQLAV